MNLVLFVWRQPGPGKPGRMVRYEAHDIGPDTSFLEMLDVVNESLIEKNEDPIAFDNDCREGICGMCGLVINGQAHGPMPRTTTCECYMRHFKDGDTVTIEPWRSTAFPIIKDLIVDRSALDRIVQAGGFISVNTGSAPESNSIPIPKETAEKSMDAAACIGCGACVAQCPNAAAQLFVSGKISHLNLLPQGQPERWERADRMVSQMEKESFGSCTNHAECEAVCPKGLTIDFIALMNRDFLRAKFKGWMKPSLRS